MKRLAFLFVFGTAALLVPSSLLHAQRGMSGGRGFSSGGHVSSGFRSAPAGGVRSMGPGGFRSAPGGFRSGPGFRTFGPAPQNRSFSRFSPAGRPFATHSFASNHNVFVSRPFG